MSTKSSVFFYQWVEEKNIHIYQEMMDDNYYIETIEGRLKIPEDVAKVFGEVLQDISKEKTEWR